MGGAVSKDQDKLLREKPQHQVEPCVSEANPVGQKKSGKLVPQIMSTHIERNLGEQPISSLMKASGLKPHDLVAHSDEQLSHKMVSRAMKGRRLTPHVQLKVLRALNNVVEKNYSLKDLFTYSR